MTCNGAKLRLESKRIVSLFFALLLVVSVYGGTTLGCGGGSSSIGSASSPSLEPETGPQKGVVVYIDDHLGNAHLITDSKGNVLREESRYPYGLDWRVDGGSAVTADYVYTGKEYDEETGLVYFGGRYYAPQMGRWVTPDLHFVENPEQILKRPLEGNLYAYVRDNPVRWIDSNGEVAGDPYPTSHSAAHSAKIDYNPISIAENREYGGFIYKMPSGSYTYTPAVRGEKDSVELNPLYLSLKENRVKIEAYYHTHAADDPCCYNEIFSIRDSVTHEPGDIEVAEDLHINAYLATPKGKLEFYKETSNQIYLLEGDRIKEGDIPPNYYPQIINAPDLHTSPEEGKSTEEY